MRRRISTWRNLVRTLCVLSLVFVGLAHRAPAIASPVVLSPIEIAALTLPDGTLPELCLPGEAGGEKAHFGAAVCEACLICSATLLPAPADVSGVPLSVVLAVPLPTGAEAFHRQIFPPNASPRAPPLPALI